MALFEQVANSAHDVVAGVHVFFSGAGETLVATDYADACPIATVAGEVASTNEILRQATADVFESWLEAARVRFEAGGVPAGEGRNLALAVVALLEGAFLLSRALRSTEPMTAAGEAAAALIGSALASAKRGSP